MKDIFNATEEIAYSFIYGGNNKLKCNFSKVTKFIMVPFLYVLDNVDKQTSPEAINNMLTIPFPFLACSALQLVEFGVGFTFVQ